MNDLVYGLELIGDRARHAVLVGGHGCVCVKEIKKRAVF